MAVLVCVVVGFLVLVVVYIFGRKNNTSIDLSTLCAQDKRIGISLQYGLFGSLAPVIYEV